MATPRLRRLLEESAALERDLADALLTPAAEAVALSDWLAAVHALELEAVTAARLALEECDRANTWTPAVQRLAAAVDYVRRPAGGGDAMAW